MSDDKELSDEEYAALMRELQQGSAGKGDQPAEAADDGGIEDIDAFLSSLEDEADQKTTTAVADGEDEDPLAAEFAALLAKGELVAPPDEPEPEEKAPTRAERRQERRREKEAEKEAKRREREAERAEREAEKEAARAAKKEKKTKKKGDGEEGEGAETSRGKRVAKVLAVNALWFTPSVIFLWVIGSYLGHWVSAGWLIAAVGLLFVYGVPAILKKLVQRGEYRPWLLGFSILLTVGLVAPLPNHAGQAMTQYGHWPASMIAEITGASPNAGFVRANAGVAGWVGGVVATQEETNWGARQLGTVFTLDTERPTTPPLTGPADPTEAGADEAGADEAPAEEPAAQEPTTGDEGAE